MNNRRSTGYGEVPYRGQPKPDELSGPVKRHSKPKKRENIIVMITLLFLTLIILAIGIVLLLLHQPDKAFAPFVLFFGIIFVDVMVISAIRKTRK